LLVAGAAVAWPGSTERVRVSTPDGDINISIIEIGLAVVQFGRSCAAVGD
jgi:hypothetical protein